MLDPNWLAAFERMRKKAGTIGASAEFHPTDGRSKPIFVSGIKLTREDWERCCRTELELRQRLVALEKAGNGIDPQLAIKWWASVGEILHFVKEVAFAREYGSRGHQIVQFDDKRAIFPVDDDLLNVAIPHAPLALLAEAAIALGTGTLPDTIAAVTQKRGARQPPQIRNLIGYATLYHVRASHGEIPDASPTNKIQRAYGVDRSTVLGWAKLPLPRAIQRLALDSDDVATEMHNAGKAYR